MSFDFSSLLRKRTYGAADSCVNLTLTAHPQYYYTYVNMAGGKNSKPMNMWIST